MGDLEAGKDEKSEKEKGKAAQLFEPVRAKKPAPSYYQPAAFSTPGAVQADGGANSSEPYKAADHQGASSVTFFVRGTNSGGTQCSYYGGGAMDDYVAMMDPQACKGVPAADTGKLRSEFDWYGGLDSEVARRAAGRKLLAEQVLPAWRDNKKVNLAGHSHGGNVVNEFGHELGERTQYLAALSGGLGAQPGSAEHQTAQAAIAHREKTILRDLADAEARYGKKGKGAEAALLADLRKELADLEEEKKGLSGGNAQLTQDMKKKFGDDLQTMQKGQLGNVMYLATPFRKEHHPPTENKAFQGRVQNFYNAYNPDDFVAGNMAGKNILGGNAAYPGFASFGHGFEVGNEACLTLPENQQMHNMPWRHQNRQFDSPFTGSHCDLVHDGNDGYHSGIRSGLAQQIQTGNYGGPNAPMVDPINKKMRLVFNNLAKNHEDIDDYQGMDPATGKLGLNRKGSGARLDLQPWRSTGTMFGGLNGGVRTPLGGASAGVDDVQLRILQGGLESTVDEAGNESLSGTLRRNTGVKNAHAGFAGPGGSADFSAGSIGTGWELRGNMTKTPQGATAYTLDYSGGDGLRMRDLLADTQAGGVRSRSKLGSFDNTTRMSGGYVHDPNGSKGVVGGASFGGMRVHDASQEFETDTLHGGAKLGSFSNTTELNGRAGWDAPSGQYFAEGGVDTGAVKLKDFQAALRSKDGRAYANGGFGGARFGGFQGGAHFGYDPAAGTLNANGGGRGGGFVIDDTQLRYGVQGLGSADAKVGQASAGGVDLGTANLSSDLQTTKLQVGGAGAHAVKLKDVSAANDLGVLSKVEAKEVSALDLNVGKATATSENFGTKGDASVTGGKFDVVKVQDGQVGKDVLGVGGSGNAGAAVDQAKVQADLLKGQASGTVQNLSVGGQVDNVKATVLGNQVALPSAGATVNVSGGANVDAFKGQADANLSLGGSNVNVAGAQLTVPQAAQVSGGVDLSKGAANANLGGQNGVGASVNLSEGKLDVNAFGVQVDVAGTAGNAYRATTGGLRDGANWTGKQLERLKFW